MVIFESLMTEEAAMRDRRAMWCVFDRPVNVIWILMESIISIRICLLGY